MVKLILRPVLDKRGDFPIFARECCAVMFYFYGGYLQRVRTDGGDAYLHSGRKRMISSCHIPVSNHTHMVAFCITRVQESTNRILVGTLKY